MSKERGGGEKKRPVEHFVITRIAAMGREESAERKGTKRIVSGRRIIP